MSRAAPRRPAPLRAALLLAALCLLAAPAGARAFGPLPGAEGFALSATDADGAPTVQAGAHPAALGLGLALAAGGGDLREAVVHLPPGFLLNPTIVPECSARAFATPRASPYEAADSGESCPGSSQLGVAAVTIGGATRHYGLFDLVAPFGALAAIGLSPGGVPLVLEVRQREADSGLDLDLAAVPPGLGLEALRLTLWGSPWDAGHDGERGDCLDEQDGGSWGSCLVFDAAPAPPSQVQSLLTMPTTPCGAPLAYAATLTSWQGAGAEAEAAGPALSGCNEPHTAVKVQLTTAAAAAPTGLAFGLDVSDGGGITNPGGIARPPIATAHLALPAGLTINPSLGAGLGVCAAAQFARESAGSQPGAGCPSTSKIGTVRLEGELALAEPMVGSVYLAAPRENPSGSLLGLYMVARDPRRGLFAASRGELVPDPRSGALEATFEELPRLLYTHFSLSLREGQRAVLLSPPLCGSYEAGLALASWAQPGVFRPDQAAMAITTGPGGGPCPAGGAPPFAPALLAGSLNPQAGAYTPFYLRLARGDGEAEITSYSAVLPPGLLADLEGVATCPDAAIEAARAASAAAAASACPAASQIGHTVAGYGVGVALAYAGGGLYLAGPYHGAPLSVVAIDPAQVGPFDLGTVVVRQAVRIDPRSARVSLDPAGSDPIPHILSGVPLHLRDLRVYVDRPHFTVDPTSCDPATIASAVGGSGADPFSAADDTTATSAQRYQLVGCRGLGFGPRLALVLGARRHGAFPALTATYSPRPGDANLGAVAVTLPPSLFLEQRHIRGVCSRADFAAGACPPGSIYGHAAARTPLLPEALEGPVYLRSSGGPLPDLVAVVSARGITIEVPGRIDQAHGGVRARFEGLPDAPLASFTMRLFGGRRGLLVNSQAACGAPHRALARFIAQSAATATARPALGARCPKRRRAHHRSRRGHRHQAAKSTAGGRR